MTRALRYLACTLSLAGLGCGSDSRFDGRIRDARAGLEDDPRIAARLAEVRAARAESETPSVFRGAQLRLRNLSASNVRLGQSYGLAVRVPINNPWEVDATRDAREHELEVAVTELESGAVESRAGRCRESMATQVRMSASRAADAFRTNLTAIAEWNRALSTGGSRDPLQARRTELYLARRLTNAVSLPVRGRRVYREYSLPALTESTRRLVVASDRIASLVREHQPLVKGHEARAKMYGAEAKRAVAGELPWFDFLQLAYDVDRLYLDQMEAQIAIHLPLDARLGARQDQYLAMREASLSEREATVRSFVREAVVALEELVLFEERAAALRDVERMAEDAESHARQWLERRHGDPMQVAQLFDEAHDARVDVLKARAAAGEAACALLEATGVYVRRWPRQ